MGSGLLSSTWGEYVGQAQGHEPSNHMVDGQQRVDEWITAAVSNSDHHIGLLVSSGMPCALLWKSLVCFFFVTTSKCILFSAIWWTDQKVRIILYLSVCVCDSKYSVYFLLLSIYNFNCIIHENVFICTSTAGKWSVKACQNVMCLFTFQTIHHNPKQGLTPAMSVASVPGGGDGV